MTSHHPSFLWPNPTILSLLAFRNAFHSFSRKLLFLAHMLQILPFPTCSLLPPYINFTHSCGLQFTTEHQHVVFMHLTLLLADLSTPYTCHLSTWILFLHPLKLRRSFHLTTTRLQCFFYQAQPQCLFPFFCFQAPFPPDFHQVQSLPQHQTPSLPTLPPCPPIQLSPYLIQLPTWHHIFLALTPWFQVSSPYTKKSLITNFLLLFLLLT